MATQIKNEAQRIYVACLEAYNDGDLHGEWIDMSQGVAEVKEQIKIMLKKYPKNENAEEYTIHDYEGFGEFEVGEYSSIEEIYEVAEFLNNEDFDVSTLSQIVNEYGIEGAEKRVELYQGKYNSWEDFAYCLIRDIGALDGVPQFIQNYFDYASYGYDLRIGGEYEEFNGHYFSTF